MKSLMLFLQQVLNELGTWCRISTSYDLKTIVARVEDEGLSFLTITLPNFGSDLQKGLAQGYVDRQLFQGFSWKKGLPKFLSGFLGLVFDRETGRLIDNPNADAIYAIRQICLMFSKIKMMCSRERITKSMKGYIDCERDIRISDSRYLDGLPEREAFQRIGRILFRGLYSDIDREVYIGRIRPRVSSGATADRLRGNSKYRSKVWHQRLEEYFPHGEFLSSSWRLFSSLSDVFVSEPGAELPVRVVTVPKTMKTPRIIAIEPFCMQYVQQGLLEQFSERIDRDDILSKFISWKSQVPNQELARSGSASGLLATLDLSEASDRVSNQHVRDLLENHPHLSRGVDSCRSRKADVPGHGVIRIAKFASMGSALCFPFESMVFLAVVFVGIEKALNRPLSMKLIRSFIGQVRIYGDDIIIPVEFVQSVISTLQTFGFKVNAGKSFWTGKFRESCGKDFYDGHDVSVVKVRELFPTSRTHVKEIQSISSLRNQLYNKGFRDTVDWLDQYILGLIPYPYVGPDSPAIGRVSDLGFIAEATHPTLHHPLVKAAVIVPRIPVSKLDDYGALLKFFLKRSEMPLDREHLIRAGRPDIVDIKVRMVIAY